jgi:predicted GNAT family acetyltransferase
MSDRRKGDGDDERLDEALDETFPASDAVAIAVDRPATSIQQPVNNVADQQFELRFSEGTAFLRYHYDAAHRLVLDHSEVPQPLRRRGIATQLAQTALDFARRERLLVVPICPFVRAYVRRHPEFNPLIRTAGGRSLRAISGSRRR